MAKMGYITEENIQSFNLPQYFPTVELLETTIQNSICFTTEAIRLTCNNPSGELPFDPKVSSLAMRIVTEGLMQEHLGSEHASRLFDIYM